MLWKCINCHLISFAWIDHHILLFVFTQLERWSISKNFYHHYFVFLTVLSSVLLLITSLVSLTLSISAIHRGDDDQQDLAKREVEDEPTEIVFEWRSRPEGTSRWYLMLLAFQWNKSNIYPQQQPWLNIRYFALLQHLNNFCLIQIWD